MALFFAMKVNVVHPARDYTSQFRGNFPDRLNLVCMVGNDIKKQMIPEQT